MDELDKDEQTQAIQEVEKALGVAAFYLNMLTENARADNAEVEALRAKVRELEREKLRIFGAFCAADSALRINYAVDMRSEADQQEARILRAYIAGDAPKDEGW